MSVSDSDPLSDQELKFLAGIPNRYIFLMNQLRSEMTNEEFDCLVTVITRNITPTSIISLVERSNKRSNFDAGESYALPRVN